MLTTAAQIVQVAKATGVQGAFIKAFKSGQELREYRVVICGEVVVAKIRALPTDHA
jgi:hypothetical protein